MEEAAENWLLEQAVQAVNEPPFVAAYPTEHPGLNGHVVAANNKGRNVKSYSYHMGITAVKSGILIKNTAPPVEAVPAVVVGAVPPVYPGN